MSFCVAFCSTSCQTASCASATSAFSRTGDERSFFHSVSGYSNKHRHRQHHPPLRPRLPAQYQSVLAAAEPCMWSSASLLRNSSSDLHLIPAGAQHESTSPASNLPRASAHTGFLCAFFPTIDLPTRPNPLAALPYRDSPLKKCLKLRHDGTNSQRKKPSKPALPDTKPIAPASGFLQVAVSEAPKHSTATTKVPSRALQIQR